MKLDRIILSYISISYYTGLFYTILLLLLILYRHYYSISTAFDFTFQKVSDLVLHLLLHLIFVLCCFVYLCYHYYFFFREIS